MATLVENKDDILTNVRTFNNYRKGTDFERKFHKRKLRNCSFFIAEKLDDGYTFIPANVVAYKNTRITDNYTIRPDTKQAISRVLGRERENGEIDVEFYDYCTQYGSTKKTPRTEPLRYWIIDDGVATREGEAGKLSDEATTTETTPEPSGDAVGTSLGDIDDERSQSEDEAGVVIGSNNCDLNTEDNVVDPSFDDLVRINEAREGEASNLSDEELRQRAHNTSPNEPERRPATINPYVRSPYVAAYVKRTAKGFCDFCQHPAPFNKNDGVPYLECHHVKTLAEGGSRHSR